MAGAHVHFSELTGQIVLTEDGVSRDATAEVRRALVARLLDGVRAATEDFMAADGYRYRLTLERVGPWRRCACGAGLVGHCEVAA